MSEDNTFLELSGRVEMNSVLSDMMSFIHEDRQLFVECDMCLKNSDAMLGMSVKQEFQCCQSIEYQTIE